MISFPMNPIQPCVFISGPLQIGPCVNVQLDLLSSTGSGGREWVRQEVEVYRDFVLIDELNSSLPANLPISLPANLFVPNSTYLFNIKLCNFMTTIVLFKECLFHIS